MTRVPLPTTKERLILELLRGNRGCYGLEIVKLSDGGLKRGTIYTTLNRMIEKGYITSVLSCPQDKAKLHTVYHIIPCGERVLLAAEAAEYTWAAAQ